MYSLLLLAGIILWPELVLCIVLFTSGHPLLGVLALITTFYSGSTAIMNQVRSAFWKKVKSWWSKGELPELGDAFPAEKFKND